jgi:hypothetical protein
MTFWQWFQENTVTLIATIILLFLLARRKFPTAAGWQAFLDSFESKGGQLLLLVVMDLIFVAVLIRYWKNFDATVQTTIVGILSAVNGAFLGQVGARPTTNGGNGHAPIPALPPAAPTAAPAVISPSDPPPAAAAPTT